MSETDLKQAVQAQFAGSAQAYVTSSVHADRADLERMVRLAGLRGAETVLDVATGGGHTARAFAPHVREVVASDLTPAMLNAAEQFLRSNGVTNVRFERADAEALPFPDATFDVVTCRVAPHHFADVQRFVQEATRVLKPDGRFILNDTIAPEDPALDQFINAIEKLRDPTHVRDYTASEWQAFCTKSGLAIEHTETFTKPIPFADWCDRSRATPDIRADLNRRLLNAPAAARAAFAIETHDEHVDQFVLHSVLIAARKA